ncbi:Minor tail protein [Trichinella pseudospiralis]
MDIQIHQSFAGTSIVIKALMDAESLRKILCEIEARLSAPVDVFGKLVTEISNCLSTPKVLVLLSTVDCTIGKKMAVRVRRDTLNGYQKWHHNRQRLRVLIAENNVSRKKWKMGKVVELYFDQDGIARTAKMKKLRA